MENQVSTLTGIAVIIATAVIAATGVFAYQYFSDLQNANNSQLQTTSVQATPNVQNSNTDNGKLSSQDAINAVKNIDEVKNYFALSMKNGQQPFAEIEQIRNGYYVVWVYEIVNNEHATTYNRYDVDIKTGEITKEPRP